MPQFLLKRFILALPVLWLLASVVFFLSRLLPGSYASEQILQESSGYYAKSSEAAKAAAYQYYLRRTGQDLPLFYFTIGAGVEPGNLHQIYPEEKRDLLQQLSWQLGNWPAATKYLLSANQLKQQLTPEQLQKHQSTFFHLLHGSYTLKTEATETFLELMPSSKPLRQLRSILAKRQGNRSFLLPALHWHGTKNQYHQWLSQIITGDFGTSFRNSRTVGELLLEAVGNTWWIIFISILLSTVLSLEISIMLAQPRFSKIKRVVMPALFVADSVPLFVLALLLLVLLASPAFLQVLPVYGVNVGFESQTWFETLLAILPYLVLPILSLVLAHVPYLVNQFYSSLATAQQADYTRTARAKGLPEALVVRKHALRNALLPIITVLSDYFPALIGGAVVIETIFAVPGMGRLLITSVQARDYPVIVAIVLLVGLFKVLAHLTADFCYAAADPRIRHQAS